MTTASVELLTEAGALLLLRACIDMDVTGSILQFLDQHCKTGAVVLSCPEHRTLCAVCPEDVLLEHRQGKRVLDSLHDHLSVLPSQGGPFDFLTEAKHE